MFIIIIPASMASANSLPGRNRGNFSLPALLAKHWQLNGRNHVATKKIMKILFLAFDTPPFRSQLAVNHEVHLSNCLIL